MIDDTLRDLLLELDQDEDQTVTSWEANFIESVCYETRLPMTAKQRATAATILKKYGYLED